MNVRMNKHLFMIFSTIFCISLSLFSSEKRMRTIQWAQDNNFKGLYLVTKFEKDKLEQEDKERKELSACFRPANRYTAQRRSLLPTYPVKIDSKLLLIACKKNDTSTVAALLKNRAFPNITDSAGNTPLHLACKNNSKEIVALLLNDADTNPNKQNNKWQTPLHIACENNDEAIVTLLCQHTRINLYIKSTFELNSLHKICLLNHYSLLAPFSTSKNWDLWRLNAQDSFGNTALSIACIQKHIFIVERLLQYGLHINPNIASEDGETPLHYAVENFCPEIITLLLKHPVTNPNIKDLRACTIRAKIILSQAEKDEGIISSESCKYPLAYKDNNTPLHLACLKNNVEAVELLLQHPKINIACLNADNFTAHAIAVRYKYKEVEQAILEYKEKLSQSCTQVIV